MINKTLVQALLVLNATYGNGSDFNKKIKFHRRLKLQNIYYKKITINDIL